MTRELDCLNIFLLLIVAAALLLSWEPAAVHRLLADAFALLQRFLEFAAAEVPHY